MQAQIQEHIYESHHMGSNFVFTAIHADKDRAWKAIQAAEEEIERIEKLISSWRPSSQTSEINRQAGIQAVSVDVELYQLIARSLKVSSLTAGAFDISYASMDRIWQFDGSMTELPDSQAVERSVAHVGFKNIELDPAKHSVFLKKKGMRIGFGAIGKGYAAMQAKEKLLEMGVASGIVNAGGDLIAWGKDVEEKNWKVAISDPERSKRAGAWLELENQALVTSGDYERFVSFQGKRYAHIIDPRTGWPVQGFKSVSILCPNAELADALATSVFVLGKEKGLALIEKLKGIECLIITDKNEIVTSRHLQVSYE